MDPLYPHVPCIKQPLEKKIGDTQAFCAETCQTVSTIIRANSIQDFVELIPANTLITEEFIQRVCEAHKCAPEDVIDALFGYCKRTILSSNYRDQSLPNISPLYLSDWGMQQILRYTRGFVAQAPEIKTDTTEQKFMQQYAEIGFRLFLLGIENFHDLWWEGNESGTKEVLSILDALTDNICDCRSIPEEMGNCFYCKSKDFYRFIAFCETIHALQGLEMANMQKQELILHLSDAIISSIQKILQSLISTSPEHQEIAHKLNYIKGRQLIAFPQLRTLSGNSIPELEQSVQGVINDITEGLSTATFAISKLTTWGQAKKSQELLLLENMCEVNVQYVRGLGAMKMRKCCINNRNQEEAKNYQQKLIQTCQFFVDFYYHQHPNKTLENPTISDFVEESVRIDANEWDYYRLVMMHNILIFEESMQAIAPENSIKILGLLMRSLESGSGFFPELRIKTCARIIESLRSIADDYVDIILELKNNVYEKESILAPIPGYSRLHLAFSVFFSSIHNDKYLDIAMESLAHYHDVVGGVMPEKLKEYKAQLLIRFGGARTENLTFATEAIELVTEPIIPAHSAGEKIFRIFSQKRESEKRLEFDKQLDKSEFRIKMTDLSESRFYEELETNIAPLIQKLFFHNHCQVSVTREDRTPDERSIFHTFKKIPLNHGYVLLFTYPKRFDDVFTAAIQQSEQYITDKIYSLIRDYSNHQLIKLQQEEIIRERSTHAITRLPNQKVFLEVLRHNPETQRTIVVIQISNLDSIGRTLNEETRQFIISNIPQSLPIYLNTFQEYSAVTFYHFEDDTFCLDFPGTPDGFDKKTLGKRLDKFFEKWRTTHLLAMDITETKVNDTPYVLNPFIGIASGKGHSILSDAQRTISVLRHSREYGYLVHSCELQAQEKERSEISHHLSQAITNQLINPHFQAIVDKYGKLVKYECLLRFDPISPLRQVPLEKVLEVGKSNPYIVEAMMGGVARKNIGNTPVSFNLTNVDLENHHLIGMLENYLAQTGSIASNVTLEILEERMNFSPKAFENLQNLKKRGFLTALDDFGSGSSNFDRIVKLLGLIDIIKLDGLTVDVTDPIRIEFVRATVSIAKLIGAQTLVEHVENEKQVVILGSHGIELFQGYHFHRPSPSPDYQPKI